jgi:hypothetical protein
MMQERVPKWKILNHRRMSAAGKSGSGYDSFREEKLLTSLRFES